jgi:hypothetical protein
MHPKDLTHYNECLVALKAMVSALGMSSIRPKERVRNELKQAEQELQNLKVQTFLKSEIENAKVEMIRIKGWQLFRDQSKREQQILEQEAQIKNLQLQSEENKLSQIKSQQSKIDKLNTQLKTLYY